MTSPETLARVERACAELVRDSETVSFAAVAARAEVSRTTLYRDESLRAVVNEYRQRGREPRTLSGVVARSPTCEALSKLSPSVSGDTRNSCAVSATVAGPTDRPGGPIIHRSDARLAG
jgi:hypothetical protein